MKTLMIDDCKKMSEYVDFVHGNALAKTYEEGISFLKTEKWDLLLLDHDLGLVDGPEKTGYDVMMWLDSNREHIPKIIKCISLNPVGRKRIEDMIYYLRMVAEGER